MRGHSCLMIPSATSFFTIEDGDEPRGISMHFGPLCCERSACAGPRRSMRLRLRRLVAQLRSLEVLVASFVCRVLFSFCLNENSILVGSQEIAQDDCRCFSVDEIGDPAPLLAPPPLNSLWLRTKSSARLEDKPEAPSRGQNSGPGAERFRRRLRGCRRGSTANQSLSFGRQSAQSRPVRPEAVFSSSNA